MPRSEDPRLAVLIDSDNSTAKRAREILAELAKYGTLTVKRAYGDWTTSRLSSWKDELNALAISPVQQFAYTTGKNATDSALIIDAMDLLYSGDVEGFCIVSSDSDFTRLCTRLREAGKKVYGIGRKTTPEAFRAACDKFIFVEVLEDDVDDGQPEQQEVDAAGTPSPKKSERGAATGAAKARKIVQPAITRTSKDNGWSSLSEVGSYIGKNHPDFDPRNYGFSKLSDLMRGIEGVELKQTGDANKQPQTWVRIKPSRKRQSAGE